jgi:hypothetical protein
VFNQSANYGSVMLLGAFQRIDDPQEKLLALEAFSDAPVPGRWSEVRGPTASELKASVILAMPIIEAAAKIRTGPPSDGDSPDAARGIWAGVIPMETHFGAPRHASAGRRGQPACSRWSTTPRPQRERSGSRRASREWRMMLHDHRRLP